MDEKTLVYKLDKILRKEFGTNLAFHEFSAGYGIADLVFAPNFAFSKKIAIRTPLTSFESLKMLLTLNEGKQYDFAEFLQLFPYLTAYEIKKQLHVLVMNGYVSKIGTSIFYKTLTENSFNPIHKIIAIEVKLNDHKNGLIQARRYQYFADESYLAILKSAEKNIDIDAFNGYNIGLILFDPGTNNIEIKHPTPTNNNHEYAVGLLAKEMMIDRFIRFAF